MVLDLESPFLGSGSDRCGFPLSLSLSAVGLAAAARTMPYSKEQLPIAITIKIAISLIKKPPHIEV
jgi:hypothetical protein